MSFIENRSQASDMGKMCLKAKNKGLRSFYSAFFICSTVMALWSYALQLEAKVTGNCSNCHTMHNSQNGAHMQYLAPDESDTKPKQSLLRGSCLGCHSKTDGSAWKDPLTGAPIVFNSQQPSYNAVMGLSAGNFYWVQTEDTTGHNIFASNPESTLNEAPGKSWGCSGTNSCHENIHGTTGPPYFGFDTSRQGCTKCHMVGSDSPKGYHHLDDTGPVVDSSAEGWFRFLDGHKSGSGFGVAGIEDDDWQYSASATDHNEYLGASGTKTSAGGFSAIGENTMTAYCTGCHGNFHIEDDLTTGSPWIRHPSDLIIPNSDEYASAFGASGATGTYNPLVPVARPTLSGWTGPSGTVTLGTDLVMCLSCHRAHASPYFKMLRWDYKSWPGNGQPNGCNVCHTSKN
ncbi:MAG: cytochrome c3 family protein [Nitrospira sp.]|nr:cytochrome c3 family protein [Nitrospira sp.]